MNQLMIVLLVFGVVIALGYLIVFLDKGLKWKGKSWLLATSQEIAIYMALVSRIISTSQITSS
jgi:hypothetical protein